MECYTINAVAMMTGFTTRTIRNYIKMGLLNGEKENGIWQFTMENLEEFFTNPNVMSALNSKRNTQPFISFATKCALILLRMRSSRHLEMVGTQELCCLE